MDIKRLRQRSKTEELEAFLDIYAKTEDCELSPDGDFVIYVRESWKEVHAKYIAHCEKLSEPYLRFTKFCNIRAAKRPLMKKHRSSRASGWDHLECSTCNGLRRKVIHAQKLAAHAKDEEERLRLDQIVKDLQALLKEHLERARQGRCNYRLRRSKAVRNRDKGDVSMIIDATGANVANYSPRFKTTEKGEPARHQMLKIKSTFLKIHRMGSVLVNTLPDLESQGGNLTVECIMIAVQHALNILKAGGVSKIRNLYIQLDNVSSNKCSTVFSALASLVLLGVCRKVKVNYLIVGHTHEDIDALIGTIVAKLRALDLPALSVYEKEVKASVLMESAQIQGVQHLIGIPDYDKLFKDCIPSTVSGILRVKELRITATEEGLMEIYYKSNSVKEGWYPKPLDDFVRPIIWQELFRHPDFDLQGDVINVEPARAVMDHGRRQYWEYKVRYAGGDIRYYQLKCISIPINLGTPEELRLRIESQELRRQEFLKSLSVQHKRDVIFEDIKSLLRARLQDDHIPEWEDYFAELSVKIDSDKFPSPIFLSLIQSAGGPIRRSAAFNSSTIIDSDDVVQPVTFRGGPIANARHRSVELDKLAEQLNLARLLDGPTRRPRGMGRGESGRRGGRGGRSGRRWRK